MMNYGNILKSTWGINNPVQSSLFNVHLMVFKKLNMQYIKIEPNKHYDGSIDYPVGKNIQQIKGYITSAIKAVKNVIPEGCRINLFCRGGSGAILAAMFAALAPWHCEVIHIKKHGEPSHGPEYPIFDKNNLTFIIDDFICSGNTMYEIYKGITANSNPFHPVHGVIVATGWDTRVESKCGFIPDHVFQTSCS